MHLEFNSSLIFMRETYELFSREIMQTGRTDPQEIWNDQSTIFQEIRSQRFRFDQEQARTMADHFASSVLSTRKARRRHLVAQFHD